MNSIFFFTSNGFPGKGPARQRVIFLRLRFQYASEKEGA